MKILSKQWSDGYLDYARQQGHCRVRVIHWHSLAPVSNLYFIPRKNARLLRNYVREIGLKEVLRKIRSRFQERHRNDKYLSCGLGEVIESDQQSLFHVGNTVVFLAPCHPKCVERLVLPEAFLRELDSTALPGRLSHDSIRFFELDSNQMVPRTWLDFAGWNEFSGSPLDVDRLQQVLQELQSHIIDHIDGPAARLAVKPTRPVRETYSPSQASTAGRLQAGLFGYGHYAKTIIIPNIPESIAVTTIHEVDPSQLGPVDSASFSCDTSAYARPSEDFDVYLVAGFHHTHSPIAVHALKAGAIAVVEKPLVTTREQLEELVEALGKSPGKLYAGFHKRYSILTKQALQDLNVGIGEAISYHCIVFEAKLPALHWYRWPNSGSRIISNGCHWLDHFLFVNKFAAIKSYDVWEASNEDIFIVVELMNGATFSMTLTDHGSSRIGVQDYVELKAGDTTVRIQNSSHYIAENSKRIIKQRKVNKMSSYHDMYRTISDRILKGLTGDTLESVWNSCNLVLLLEEKLRQRRHESSMADTYAALAAPIAGPVDTNLQI